jgi:DHA1 family tetracycline resistance protein-like MFS transporter
VLAAIVQGGLIKKIVGALGERHALLFDWAAARSASPIRFAPNGYWFWSFMPIAALWGARRPRIAIMTHHVDPREQGRLQGAVASLSAIAGIIAPTLFTRTFAAVTQANMHGAWAGITFGLASVMVGAALVLAWYTVSHLPPAVTIATQPPEAIVTSQIIAGSADLEPPLNQNETRA